MHNSDLYRLCKSFIGEAYLLEPRINEIKKTLVKKCEIWPKWNNNLSWSKYVWIALPQGLYLTPLLFFLASRCKCFQPSPPPNAFSLAIGESRQRSLPITLTVVFNPEVSSQPLRGDVCGYTDSTHLFRGHRLGLRLNKTWWWWG